MLEEARRILVRKNSPAGFRGPTAAREGNYGSVTTRFSGEIRFTKRFHTHTVKRISGSNPQAPSKALGFSRPWGGFVSSQNSKTVGVSQRGGIIARKKEKMPDDYRSSGCLFGWAPSEALERSE
jgi:hypothetical protein